MLISVYRMIKRMTLRMRMRMSFVPKFLGIIAVISMFIVLNILYTSKLAKINTKRDSNSSYFNLPFVSSGRFLFGNISDTDTPVAPAESKEVFDAQSPYFLTALQLGHLGNNMFQYAGILGLAKMNGRRPFFPASSRVNQVFEITHVADIKEARRWVRLGEANHGKYEPKYESLPKTNLTLVAYLQSFKYFLTIMETVKQEFKFKQGIQRRADALMNSMSAKINGRTAIGVHVRRRDLLTVKERKLGSLTAPKSYLVQAFEWMRAKHGSVVFLVATDDEEWCNQNIIDDKDVILLPQSTGDVHMCALASCHHMIMTVGTFGWWAGWLGGGDVVYYTQQHMLGSWKSERFSNADFFPSHWVGFGDSPLSMAEISLLSGKPSTLNSISSVNPPKIASDPTSISNKASLVVNPPNPIFGNSITKNEIPTSGLNSLSEIKPSTMGNSIANSNIKVPDEISAKNLSSTLEATIPKLTDSLSSPKIGPQAPVNEVNKPLSPTGASTSITGLPAASLPKSINSSTSPKVGPQTLAIQGNKPVSQTGTSTTITGLPVSSLSSPLSAFSEQANATNANLMDSKSLPGWLANLTSLTDSGDLKSNFNFPSSPTSNVGQQTSLDALSVAGVIQNQLFTSKNSSNSTAPTAAEGNPIQISQAPAPSVPQTATNGIGLSQSNGHPLAWKSETDNSQSTLFNNNLMEVGDAFLKGQGA